MDINLPGTSRDNRGSGSVSESSTWSPSKSDPVRLQVLTVCTIGKNHHNLLCIQYVCASQLDFRYTWLRAYLSMLWAIQCMCLTTSWWLWLFPCFFVRSHILWVIWALKRSMYLSKINERSKTCYHGDCYEALCGICHDTIHSINCVVLNYLS